MKMYCILFACLSIVLYTITAEAQTIYRRNITPTGYQINDCSIIGDSTIITAGNDGTILYSENMFLTWNKAEILVRQHLHGIVHISAEKCIAVGDDGIILLGEGYGKTWSIQQTAIRDSLYDITLTDKGILFAVGNNGCIVQSTDKGITWSAEYYTELGNARKVVFFDSIGIITGTGKTLLRSEDWGNTWQKIQHPYYTIYSLCHRDNNTWFVGCDSLRAGFSEDNGKTWSNAKRILPQARDNIGFIEIKDMVFTDDIHGYAVGVLYADYFNILYNDIIITNDGGKTWTSAQRNLIMPGSRRSIPYFTSLYRMPDKQSILLCGRYNSEYDPYLAIYTNNSWKHLLFGEGERVFMYYDKDTADYTPNFSAIRFFTQEKGIALQRGGFNYRKKGVESEVIQKIVRTEDGGRTWNNSLFLFDSLRINNVYAINADDIIAEIVKSTNNQKVESYLRSYDGGITWNKDTTLLRTLQNTLKDTVSTIEKIFSVDNGDYYCTLTKTSILSSYNQNYILLSTNKGLDWKKLRLPTEIGEEFNKEVEIRFSGADKIILFGNVYDSINKVNTKKMIMSNNGGKDWQTIFKRTNVSFRSYAINRKGNSIWRAEFEDSPIDKTIPVWAKIISSRNNGETWDTLDLEKDKNTALFKNMFCSRLNFIDENTGIMEMTSKNNSLVSVVHISTDGGKEWRYIPYNSYSGYLTYNLFDKNTVFLGAKRNSLYYFDPQEIPTGITEAQTTSAIVPIHIWNAFPNPTEKGKINLMLTWLEHVQPNDINFRLYTVDGIEQTHTVTVENWIKGGSGNGTVTLNLQSVPNGLYILSCESGTYKTAKIIIVDR